MKTYTIYDRFNPSVVLFKGEGESLSAVVVAAVKSGTNLSRANLSGGDLSWADFYRANLSPRRSPPNLSGADLSHIKQDLWDVLIRAPREIEGLRIALQEGKVDGSCYEGSCACLVGTIANIAHQNYQALDGLIPNSSRPAERWFLAIHPGDTPAKSVVTKLTIEWIEEFQELLARAVSCIPSTREEPK